LIGAGEIPAVLVAVQEPRGHHLLEHGLVFRSYDHAFLHQKKNQRRHIPVTRA